MYAPPDMTSQTGTAYKAPIDADLAALAGISGKRRNINGDGRVNQLAAGVTGSTSFQYLCDMWEMKYSAAGGTGSYTAVTATTFPAGVGIGCLSLGTTGVNTASFRTKMLAENVKDLAFAPYIYPVAAPAHPFVSVGILAFQDTAASINVTATLFSADASNNFSAMSNSLVGATHVLPTGQVTAINWEGGNAFQLDSLTNAANGLCLQLDFALPAAAATNKLILGDVQLEGGQVCSFYGRGSADNEVRACKRFYHELMSGVVNEGVAMAQCGTTTTAFAAYRPPVEMFKAPTLVLSAASHFGVTNASGGTVAVTGLTIANTTLRAVEIRPVVASGLIAGNVSELFATSTSARLALDARI